MLGEKGLDGEVADLFVDYKEQALKSFIDIIELSKSAAVAKAPGEPPAKGKDASAEEEEAPKYTSFT